jgi:hypothetical protein
MTDSIIDVMIEKLDNIKSLIKSNKNNIELLNNASFNINELNAMLLDYNSNSNYYITHNVINNNNIDEQIYNIYLPYILYTQLILQNK